MSGYILRRADGKYVARPGSEHSYTTDLTKALIFTTREAAEADRCVGNELVVAVDHLLQR